MSVPMIVTYRGLISHCLSTTSVMSVAVSTWYMPGGLECRYSMVAVGWWIVLPFVIVVTALWVTKVGLCT